MAPMSTHGKPVLFFDGECGLCNAIVRFMLRRDRLGVLMFAPLQGESGQAFLKAKGMNTQDFDSLVFTEDIGSAAARWHLRSAGALQAMAALGGGWGRFARMLTCVPSSWLDVLYKIVARARYRLFGRYRPRPLPDPEWAARFLP